MAKRVATKAQIAPRGARLAIDPTELGAHAEIGGGAVARDERQVAAAGAVQSGRRRTLGWRAAAHRRPQPVGAVAASGGAQAHRSWSRRGAKPRRSITASPAARLRRCSRRSTASIARPRRRQVAPAAEPRRSGAIPVQLLAQRDDRADDDDRRAAQVRRARLGGEVGERSDDDALVDARAVVDDRRGQGRVGAAGDEASASALRADRGPCRSPRSGRA